MTGRTHDLAAVSFLSLAFVLSPLEKISITTLFLCLLFNQIGGILPDIDQPTAPLWKNLPVTKSIGRIIDKVLFGGHRFLTHSIVGLVIFTLLAYFLLNIFHSSNINNNLIIVSFVIGYLSHLVFDSITKEGVPWLLPITKKFGIPPTKKFRIETGGIVEHLFIFPGLIVFDFILILENYSMILLFFKNYLIR